MPAYALTLNDAERARYRSMAERARLSEAALWAAAGIKRGARVADIGCGPGAVLALLADIVGPDGSAVGIDADSGAVAAARSLLGSAAQVRVGRADDTGLEPGSFDAVMLRHVLAHNGGSEERIVAHLASLVRPGGTVYLLDVDLTAFRMAPEPADLDDLLQRYAAFHRQRGNDPQIGLRLKALAQTAELDVEAYRGWFEIVGAGGMGAGLAGAAGEAMVAEGAATADELRRWQAAWQRLRTSREPTLFYMALFVTVARRKL